MSKIFCNFSTVQRNASTGELYFVTSYGDASETLTFVWVQAGRLNRRVELMAIITHLHSIKLL
jgi:hypothetical protein